MLVIGSFYIFLKVRDNDKTAEDDNKQTNSSEGIQTFDKTKYSIDEPGSLWWIVNKTRALPEKYIPSDLTAPNIKLRWENKTAESMQVREVIRPDLELLYQASQKAGYKLMLVSAYRSYTTQKELYDNYVKTYGEEEASQFSAKPGTSEHQTGLVVDLGRTDHKCELEQCLGDLPEGKWLADHAYEYGFIVRYLKDKQDITGYMYEPWHFRYVGKDLAKELHNSGQTMEEFFSI